MKIGFIGASGTGKSTLANKIANELGIPFLSSRTITQPILERDGYDYRSGVQIERFLSSADRQEEILSETLDREQGNRSYVTDRTVIDLAAYAINELHFKDMSKLTHIYQTCREQSYTYTHLILCPWRDSPIESNERRTLNNWYQFVIHSLNIGVINEWGIDSKLHWLKTDGEDDRMGEIRKIIAGGYN